MISTPYALRQLFNEGFTTYAILDGAQVPELPQRLHASGLEYVCLYRGEIPDDLAQVAPYLVALKRDDKFTAWLLKQGWGLNWGIYVVTDNEVEMKEVRKHFRGFLKVKSPQGDPIYFRYYDPRVLRAYLPTCNEQELKTIFGPVVDYVVEAEEAGRALRFSPKRGTVEIRTEIIV
jgi:hypothetical protein